MLGERVHFETDDGLELMTSIKAQGGAYIDLGITWNWNGFFLLGYLPWFKAEIRMPSGMRGNQCLFGASNSTGGFQAFVTADQHVTYAAITNAWTNVLDNNVHVSEYCLPSNRATGLELRVHSKPWEYIDESGMKAVQYARDENGRFTGAIVTLPKRYTRWTSTEVHYLNNQVYYLQPWHNLYDCSVDDIVSIQFPVTDANLPDFDDGHKWVREDPIWSSESWKLFDCTAKLAYHFNPETGNFKLYDLSRYDQSLQQVGTPNENDYEATAQVLIDINPHYETGDGSATWDNQRLWVDANTWSTQIVGMPFDGGWHKLDFFDLQEVPGGTVQDPMRGAIYKVDDVQHVGTGGYVPINANVTDQNLWLFAHNNAGYPELQADEVEIKRLMIRGDASTYRGNVTPVSNTEPAICTLADFRPARYNGTPGVFDMISERFYGNSGPGTLIVQ